ncbi:hypothetical protein CL1_0836 [Thermococcus cleftensis]|uniref:Glucosyltransferase 3-like C-terminal domain-containing protein n=2 Tax=Thermococcus cleftensis (strain DSM 27260 / KACC 17922 / CL1) TaxID=163003 RepID=I3ZTK7_THECF|nr:hypothetical protein CL1_0836 [Thermococcus cleftensis]
MLGSSNLKLDLVHSPAKFTTVIPLSNYSPATSHLLADVSRFSLELGFNVVKIPRIYIKNTKFPKVWREFHGLPKYISAIKKSDILLIPYPALFTPVYPSTILSYHDLKNIHYILEKKRYIVFVFDLPIERERTKGRVGYSIDIEKKLFKDSSAILTFNPQMDKVLRERYGLEDKVFVHFEILDYYTEFIPPEHKSLEYPRKAVLAGNLSKQYIGESLIKYLENYSRDDIVFTLIGRNQSWIKSLPPNIKYKGFINNRMKLHKEISKQDFGIISYSSSLIPYLRFGSTSKFSTYIASGIPVIVPVKATYLTKIVKKYNVGVTYKNENGIEKTILRITSHKYLKLRKNVLELANKIREGYFFKRALLQALESIDPKR